VFRVWQVPADPGEHSAHSLLRRAGDEPFRGPEPLRRGSKNPLCQSFNVTLQRELTSKLTLDVTYIGNKASKLVTGSRSNDVDIVDNGVLTPSTSHGRRNAPLSISCSMA